MNRGDERAEQAPLGVLLWSLLLCTLVSPVLPGLALTVIAVYAGWTYRKELFERDYVAWTFLAFAGVAALGALVQQTAWGFVSIVFFLLYFTVYVWLKREVSVSQFQTGLSFMSLAGVGIVFVMVVNRWGGFDFLPSTALYFFGLESWKPTDSLRSTGTSGNANLAASLLVSLALITFYKLVRPSASFKDRLIWAVAFSAYLYGFILTGTRMAWIALAFGVAVQLQVLYAEWAKRRLKQLAFSHLFTIFALAGLLLGVKGEWLPRANALHTDLALRLEIWERALHIFHDNWLFGVLPLHFGEVFLREYGTYEYHAHNLFIGIAVDFGIVGFALFVLLLAVSVIRGIQWLHWSRDTRDRELATVLLSIVFGYLGHGLADYTILVPQTGWLFLMALGYIHIRWLQLAPLHVRPPDRKLAQSARTVHSIPK